MLLFAVLSCCFVLLAASGPALCQDPAGASAPAPQPGPPDTPDPDRFLISTVDFRGDVEWLNRMRMQDAIRSEIAGKTLTEQDILDIVTRHQDLCTKAGYYLARLKIVPADLRPGVLTIEVDKGRVGRMSFFDGNGPRGADGNGRVPFAGTYYSEAQLRRQLRLMKEEDTFNYEEFYRTVFALNAHPDIKMDTNLSLRKDASSGSERRYADMEFFVREGTPVHGVAEVKNTGTESTEEWRTSLTFQHLNLTRHNDILTFNTLSSLDLSSLLSFAASYNLPFNTGNGGSFTIYGGYSDVTAEEVVPEIDLIGIGWFACIQASYNLQANKRRLLSVAVSATYKGVENKLSFNNKCDTGNTVEQTDQVTLIPMAAALSYSSVKPDCLGGRNFLASQTAFSVGGSDSDELAAQRVNAKADYMIERLQLARLQPLFGRTGKDGARSGEWILFLKADGQLANAPLVPAEQKAVGGMDSARGYQERECLGDDGVSGTIELRTPLAGSPFARLFNTTGKGDTPAEGAARIQFVAFVDGGYVSLKEPVVGIDSSQSLLGVGAGLRVAAISHLQLRFDWGFPFIETTTSESSGRGHLSIQGQF